MTEQLLNVLGRRASSQGRVVAHQESLVQDLQASVKEIREGLRMLEEARLIDVLSPLPFLVIRLRSWSGHAAVLGRPEAGSSSSKQHMHGEVPVSSAAAASQQPEVGGAGEGGALLEEVLVVLGPDADREEFQQILAGESAALIHRCLKRVQATHHIRVSKPALFRSLLRKLSI